MSKIFIVQIEGSDWQDNYTTEVRADSPSEASRVAKQGLGWNESVGHVEQKYKSKKKKTKKK